MENTRWCPTRTMACARLWKWSTKHFVRPGPRSSLGEPRPRRPSLSRRFHAPHAFPLQHSCASPPDPHSFTRQAQIDTILARLRAVLPPGEDPTKETRLAFSRASVEEPERLAAAVEAVGVAGAEKVAAALATLAEAMRGNTMAWMAERDVARDQIVSHMETLCQSHPSQVAQAWAHSMALALQEPNGHQSAAGSHLAGTAQLQDSLTAGKGRLLCHSMLATWTREAHHAKLAQQYEASAWTAGPVERLQEALEQEAEARERVEEQLARLQAEADESEESSAAESAVVAMEEAVQRMTEQVAAMEMQLAEADEREHALRDEIRRLQGCDGASASPSTWGSPIFSPTKRTNRGKRTTTPLANQSNRLSLPH